MVRVHLRPPTSVGSRQAAARIVASAYCLLFTATKHGAIAQLGERLLCTQKVRGSNPRCSTASRCGMRVHPLSRICAVDATRLIYPPPTRSRPRQHRRPDPAPARSCPQPLCAFHWHTRGHTGVLSDRATAEDGVHYAVQRRVAPLFPEEPRTPAGPLAIKVFTPIQPIWKRQSRRSRCRSNHVPASGCMKACVQNGAASHQRSTSMDNRSRWSTLRQLVLFLPTSNGAIWGAAQMHWAAPLCIMKRDCPYPYDLRRGLPPWRSAVSLGCTPQPGSLPQRSRATSPALNGRWIPHN